MEQLVDLYNETAEQKLTVNAVVVHELLFHLSWLDDAMKTQPKRVGGHAPEHYAELLGGILRRAALRETGTADEHRLKPNREWTRIDANIKPRMSAARTRDW